MSDAGQPASPTHHSRVDAARSAAQRAGERARALPGAPAIIESFEREQRSGAGLLAGGLAYRLFFWLVPFGLLVAAVASFWSRSSEGSLEHTAKRFGLAGAAAQSAVSAVEDGSHARWYLLAAGLFFVLYFGVGAVKALRVAAFIAWQIPPSRLRRMHIATATFTGICLLALAITLFDSWVRRESALLGPIATVASAVAFLAVAAYVFTLLPKPDDVGWFEMLPGAAMVGVGLTGVHVLVVYYLAGKLEREPKLYGTLGAATVFLLALYLIGRVVISGMFLNATLYRRRIARDAA